MPQLRPVVLAMLAALASSSAYVGAAATASAQRAKPRTRYARVRHVCRPARPRDASCFAQALVPVAAGTAGAAPYVTAAGAASTGPAGGLTPADLASAYAYSPAGGAGQTVAIVDAFDDPAVEADLATFDAQYGLPACTTEDGCFEKVGQSGSRTALPAADRVGWSAEISLDVETVHSVCGGCKILLVEANSERFADLAASVDEAVALGASEVSNSYGGVEPSIGAPEQAAYNHPGVVITASSGDSGYLNWDFVASAGAAPGKPDEPASLPSVVAVGGTALQLTTAGARKRETVWNDSGRPSVEEFKRFSATGSGCSTLFAAPSWQQEASGWATTACGGKRLENDVAAVADPYTGFDVYDSYAFEPKFTTGWLTIGGTSLSSPLIAGLYALAGGSLGTAYPAVTLYSHLGQPSALYDVSEGGSGYCDGEAPLPCGEPGVNELLGNVDCEGTTACDAIVGFDGPSGVGTPNGIAAFASTPVAPTVTTGQASDVRPTTAVLNATVDPNGQTVATCLFEYGASAAYGSTTPCTPAPGAGVSPAAVSAPLGGLSAGTTYHFRIVAANATGRSEGADQSFTTGDPPEYGRCTKLAKGVHGAYSTASCTAAATPERFAYEWEPGPGPNPRFTSTIKPLTTATIETVGGRKVLCSGASGSGEYSGRKTVTNVTVTFTGCALAGVSCSSPGSAEGVLATAKLAGTLGLERRSAEGPLKDRAALDLAAEGEGGTILEFDCGLVGVSVRGSVLDPVASDRMAARATVRYAAAAGRQRPEGFEGLPVDVLEAAFGQGSFEQAALKLTSTTQNEAAIEVNTVV
jgi:hypothetical protein